MSRSIPSRIRPSRRAAVAVALALATLTSACASAAGSSSKPARTRAVPSWTRTVPGWPSSVVATPDGDGVVVVSGDSTVTAIDARGARRWAARVDGVSLEDPSVGGGVVAVPAGDRLVALDPSDGSVRFRADVPTEVGAVLATRVGRNAIVVDAPFDGMLETRAASDGHVIWATRDDGEVRSRPVVDAHTRTVVAVWFTHDGSTVRAFDAGTGALRWQRVVPPYASAPVVVDGRVVLGAGDDDYVSAAHAFDLVDGTEAWTTRMPASFEPGLEPVVAGRDVVLVDHFGAVTSIDARTGVQRWQTGTGAATLDARPVVGAESVVVTTGAREVVWLDRATGVVRSRWAAPGVPEAIARAGGSVVVGLRRTEPGRVEAHAL